MNVHIIYAATGFNRCLDVITEGCSQNCVQDIHHLGDSDIWVTRNRFSTLSAFQQRQWLLDYMHLHTTSATGSMNYIVSGKDVCLPVWLSVLGLSKSRFYDVKRLFNQGAVRIERLVSPKPHSPKSQEAIAWMEFYFNQVGDHLPDRMAIHLPSFLTTNLVYRRMSEEFASKKQAIISQSHFYKLWSTEFRHVTIPKVIMKH